MTEQEVQPVVLPLASPRERLAGFLGRGHRTAIPTELDGIRFPSKTQARVYARLRREAQAEGARLYREVRFPLLNLSEDEHLKPAWFTPDFVLVYPDNTVRIVDAKARKWKSPEWQRGKRAFEAWYGVKVEEVHK